MESLEICFCVMALIYCDTFAVLKLQTVHNNAVLVAKIKDAKYIAISDVVIASVHSEKTRLKKMIMIIIIIIIMNRSQELTVFHGRQKLTSAKN